MLKVGTSPLTVGRWGCTITCISMLSDYFGSYKSPAELAQNANLFTSDGLVIWNRLDFQNMKFVTRMYGDNEASIKESLRDPNKAVLLQVDNGQHWILPTRETYVANDYLAVDPWTAKFCAAKGDYRNVTGSAHFMRK